MALPTVAMASVETVWTVGNKHLSEDGKMTLTGTFSFSGSKGGVSCPATIKLLLESSTVEENAPEGEIESFTVSKPAECDVSGGYEATCGTHSVTSVEQTGTATIRSNGEEITVTGLVLDYKFASCSIAKLRIEGNPKVSVNNPESVSSVTFGGGSFEVFNSANETSNTASAGGSASASPSGTYQLQTNKHQEETESVALTEEEEPLEVGAEVTATSTNLTLTTIGGTLSCAAVTLHSEVQENGPTSVHLGNTSVTTEGCNATITSAAFGTVTFEGEGTGVSTGFSFTVDVGISCTLSGTLGLTYVSGTDVFSIPGSALSNTCGGGAEAHGDFTLETEDGTPVVIS